MRARRVWVASMAIVSSLLIHVVWAASLDEEAKTHAGKYYEQFGAICDKNEYLLVQYRSRAGGPLDTWELYQYRGVKGRLIEKPLTAADRLNGIEWVGAAVLEPEAYRVYSSKTKQWQPWENFPSNLNDPTNRLMNLVSRQYNHDVFLPISMAKKHGQWAPLPNRIEKEFYVIGHLTCDQVSAMLKRK
ncbi:MAG: hypothetical protein Q8R30_04685 [bacterium]|nr:hypothetical protein [bacterium]